MSHLSYVAEGALTRTWEELKAVHWIPMFGAITVAYLFNFYASVYLEINKPPSLIIFIGTEQLPNEG